MKTSNLPLSSISGTWQSQSDHERGPRRGSIFSLCGSFFRTTPERTMSSSFLSLSLSLSLCVLSAMRDFGARGVVYWARHACSALSTVLARPEGASVCSPMREPIADRDLAAVSFLELPLSLSLSLRAFSKLFARPTPFHSV